MIKFRSGHPSGRSQLAFIWSAIGFLASVVLVAVPPGSVGAAEPAPTVCTSSHPLTGPVHGDVVVPYLSFCFLEYDIDGNVVLDYAAGLAGSAHVTGNLRVGRDADAIFDSGGGVGGYVVLDHAAAFDLDGGTVGGSVVGSLWPSFAKVSLRDSNVLGRLAISGAEPGTTVHAVGLHVAGDTIFDGVRVAMQGGATLGGRLVLRHVVDGTPFSAPYVGKFSWTVVCGAKVSGNVTVEHSSGTVEIGAGSVCRTEKARMTIGGAFLAHDNAARILLGGDVAGNADCRSNLHHPHGDGSASTVTTLHVSGKRSGQCARLPRP